MATATRMEHRRGYVRVRVKPHPVCPACGIVMTYYGLRDRVSYYKCPRLSCGCTAKLIDAFDFVQASDMPDRRGP